MTINKKDVRKNYCIKAFEKFNIEITNLSEAIIKIGNSYLSTQVYYSEFSIDQEEIKEIIKELNINNQFVIISKAIQNFLMLSYLYDLRIEIMNKFMSDIFKTNVPERKLLRKSKRLLREVAIKEEVEKEFSQLENQYLNKN